jgi:hypothetical protein
MADIPQVIATYDALVGVVLGAGLTYGFSALNRRYQEAREDKTRWYEARLQVYIDFYTHANQIIVGPYGAENEKDYLTDLENKLYTNASTIDLLGSPNVRRQAWAVYRAIVAELRKAEPFEEDLIKLMPLLNSCRKDLGLPSPWAFTHHNSSFFSLFLKPPPEQRNKRGSI